METWVTPGGPVLANHVDRRPRAPLSELREILRLSRQSALRSDAFSGTPPYNSMLVEQLAASWGRAGEIDLDALLALVSARYDSLDDERRGAVLSMQLMSDEAQALTRAIRQESAARLQAILDQIEDAVVTLDPAGRIETCNAIGEAIFGYPMRDLLGNPLDFLLPDAAVWNDVAAFPVADGGLLHFLERCAGAAGCAPTAHPVRGLTRDGSRVALEMTVGRVPEGRRGGYVVSLRDVTERSRGRLIAAGERRVFEKISANAPLEAVLQAIADVIERAVPGGRCAIDLLDAENRCLRHGVAPRLPREFVAAMDRSPVGLAAGSSAAAVHLGRRVLTPDIDAAPCWESRAFIAAYAGLKSAWVEPIVAADGSVVATLAIYGRHAGLPREREEDLMSRQALIAGIAVGRYRLSPASRCVRGETAR